jgi:uncharacterized protein
MGLPSRPFVRACALGLAAAWMLASAPPARARQAVAGPSFDCRKATHEAELAICKDAGLAALDRRMADVFAAALQSWPAAVARDQRVTQIGWIRGRNDCWKSKTLRRCVEEHYWTRLYEIQELAGRLKPPLTATFACNGDPAHSTLTAAFYNDLEPQTAVVTVGGAKAVLFLALSGSGSRYTADMVEYWEHQGEATVDWYGTALTCTIKP